MELNLTQEELATAIGYRGAPSISQIESGLRPLTNSKLVALAKFLGVHPSEIRGTKLEVVRSSS